MLSEQSQKDRQIVNNDYYHSLGHKWYSAKDDPVALLRAEAKTRNPWISARIRDFFFSQPVHVLDVGCGAGFLANYLAQKGLKVTGLDVSAESVAIAKLHDSTKNVNYVQADAYNLPFPDHSFEVVTCTDFLEHVADPVRVLQEISRVIKPQGLFFFHTFNRNPLAWLVVIKGVEWFVKNTPQDLHSYRLFIKPKFLISKLTELGFSLQDIRGLRPCFNRAFLHLLRTGEVNDNFRFRWVKSISMSYTGYAIKDSKHQ